MWSLTTLKKRRKTRTRRTPPSYRGLIGGSTFFPEVAFRPQPHDGHWDKCGSWWITNETNLVPAEWEYAPSFEGEHVPYVALQRPLAGLTRQGKVRVFPRLDSLATIARLLGVSPDEDVLDVDIDSFIPHASRFETTPELTDRLRQCFPSWFGLNLYDYQVTGALHAHHGHYLIADPMGLGKTRQALAAASLDNPRRMVVISPPVALTSWGREVTLSGVTRPDREDTRPEPAQAISPDTQPGDWVEVLHTGVWKTYQGVLRDKDGNVLLTPKTKKPRRGQIPIPIADMDFPDEGTVIVSDMQVALDNKFARRLRAWDPDVVIIDEVHRIKTPSSSRSKAVRDVAKNAPRVYGLSGTPVFAKVYEMYPLLDAVKLLGPVFRGFKGFTSTYCYKTPFNSYETVMGKLPQLRRLLDERVWVRRETQAVLPNLPDNYGTSELLDVDTALFDRAHDEVIEDINEWIDEYTTDDGSLPEEPEVDAFCKSSLSLISKLRSAAGLTKVAAAQETVERYLGNNPGEPLIIWTHHQDVTKAMAQMAKSVVDPSRVRVIAGGTGSKRMGEIADEFQAGDVDILIASITAAGVSITLTRGRFSLFVEADWTPANIQQAMKRTNRIGQSRDTHAHTLVAVGTLDETIQFNLHSKSRVLSPLLGADQDASVVGGEAQSPAYYILRQIVDEVMQARQDKNRRSTRTSS